MYHDHEIDIILDETRENNPKQFLFFLFVIAFEGVVMLSVRCRCVAISQVCWIEVPPFRSISWLPAGEISGSPKAKNSTTPYAGQPLV